MPTARKAKENISSRDPHKLKIFCTVKETTAKQKDTLLNGGNICTPYIRQRTDKDLQQIHVTQQNNPIKT